MLPVKTHCPKRTDEEFSVENIGKERRYVIHFPQREKEKSVRPVGRSRGRAGGIPPPHPVT